MSADDQLDQDQWNPGGIIPQPGPMIIPPSRLTVDQQVRVVAVQAAATWLAGVDPYPTGVTFLVDTADQLAHWIATGERA